MRRGDTAGLLRKRFDAAVASAMEEVAGTVGDQHAIPVVGWVPLHLAAAPCPAEAFGPAGGEFEEVAATAARRIGLTALRECFEGSPSAMVSQAVQHPELFGPSLADWLAGLDRAGRAAVAAEATSWLVDTRALAQRARVPEWQSAANISYEPGGSGVKVAVACDAVRRMTDGILHLYLTRPTSGPRDRRICCRIALVWALVRGEVPGSVVLGYRDSLRRGSFSIGDAEIDLGIADAVTDVRYAVAPVSAPAVTGERCHRCRLLEDCEPGERWVRDSAHRRVARLEMLEAQLGSGCEPTM